MVIVGLGRLVGLRERRIWNLSIIVILSSHPLLPLILPTDGWQELN